MQLNEILIEVTNQLSNTTDYSQSSNLTELRSLKKDWVKEQRGMIRDRGYIWNSYLDGGQS